MRVQRVLGVGLFVGLLIWAGVELRAYLGVELSPESIRAWVDALGWAAPLVYVGLLAFRQFVALPASVILPAGGALFGVVLGTLLGAVGVLVSGAICFGIGRGFASGISPGGARGIQRRLARWRRDQLEHVGGPPRSASGARPLATGPRVPETGPRTPETGPRIAETGPRIPETGPRAPQTAATSVPDAGAPVATGGVGTRRARPGVASLERRARDSVRVAGPVVIGMVTAHPTGPMTALHTAAGMSSLSWATFLTSVGIGALVRAFVLSYFGAALLAIGSPQFWVATVLIVLAATVPFSYAPLRAWVFGRRSRRAGADPVERFDGGAEPR